MKEICHQYYILDRNKRSHDPETHYDYMIILDLAKSPFVNTVLRQNLAETKVLTLRLDLSLRPFVNTSPGDTGSLAIHYP